MDIYLLNDNFEIVRIIDDFTSLIWHRRYYESGSFELHCVHTLFPDIAGASYICRPDRQEIGVIESYSLDVPTCSAKGRFLECLAEDKIIYPTKKYSGKTQEFIARDLVASFLPNIRLATANDPQIGSAITTQVTGKNLMEYLYEQLAAVEASFSLNCNLATKAVTFRVWQGADRTASAIFSQEWDNLKSFSYQYAGKDIKNYALVAGAGEGTARKNAEVDNSQGGRRREIFVDARDMQQDENESDSDYTERLRQRGREKLAEYGAVESCECEADTQSNLVYMEAFNLGDICTIKDDEHCIICQKRITECEEVYENGSFSLSLKFGSGFLILPKYLERKLT